MRGGPSNFHDDTTADDLQSVGQIIEDALNTKCGDEGELCWNDIVQTGNANRRNVKFYRKVTLGQYSYHCHPLYLGNGSGKPTSRYDYFRFNNHDITQKCWYGQIICLFEIEHTKYTLVRYMEQIHKNGMHPKIPHRYMKFTNTGKGDKFHYDVQGLSTVSIEEGRLPPNIVAEFDGISNKGIFRTNYFDLEYKHEFETKYASS